MSKPTRKGIYFSNEKLTEADKMEIRNAIKLAEKRKRSMRQQPTTKPEKENK